MGTCKMVYALWLADKEFGWFIIGAIDKRNSVEAIKVEVLVDELVVWLIPLLGGA